MSHWSKMMIALPVDVADSNQPENASLQADLAAIVIHLLECAKRHLDNDPKQAVASITRASSLLQFEVDRMNAGADGGPSQGALAAWQANRVRAYIDNHLETSIQIRDLAAVARRSNAYFCRAFKRTFGETPHAFIVGRRLLRATELMLTSDASLAQVALACGFSDQAHLSKVFRQRHGQSPAMWRRERRDVSSRAVASASDLEQDSFRRRPKPELVS
jgi:AraC-like DNA-binding protein